jgi:hypothetical protein
LGFETFSTTAFNRTPAQGVAAPDTADAAQENGPSADSFARRHPQNEPGPRWCQH